jgi:hypothetical protein
MTLTAFSGTVRVRLEPSLTLVGLMVVSHLTGALSLLLLPWPRILVWTFLLLNAVLLVRGLRREAWLCSGHSVMRLDVAGDGRLCVFRKNGRRALGRVLPGSFVAPRLVILRWRPERGGSPRCCIVAGDATDPITHRMLRVLLRHPL